MNSIKRIFNYPLFIFIFLLVLTPLISGYEIVPISQNFARQYEPFRYTFFVYNESNLINDSSMKCYFYLTNSEGEEIFSGEAYYKDYWSVNISNFTNVGIYSYGIKCFDDVETGVFSGEIEVRTIGKQSNLPLILFMSLGSILLFIIGLVFKNVFIGFFSGLLTLASATYIMIYGFNYISNDYSKLVALILIGLGALISLNVVSEFLGYYNSKLKTNED